MTRHRKPGLTREELVAGVAAGVLAESFRMISRLCECPWTGPVLDQGVRHWRRTGTSKRCPLRAHIPWSNQVAGLDRAA